MRVYLKRDWFAPDNRLFAKNDNPNEIPDDFANDLPSDAEIEGEDVKAREARKSKSKNEAEKSLKTMKATPLSKLEA